jgi:hypothetical protein
MLKYSPLDMHITTVVTEYGEHSHVSHNPHALCTALLAPLLPSHSPQTDIDEGYGSQIVSGVLTAYPCPADTFRPLLLFKLAQLTRSGRYCFSNLPS